MAGRKHEKIAKIVVKEVNSIDKLNAMFEMGMRLKSSMDDPDAFGMGCGNHCDATGIAVGVTV